ncbi:hypothetical protein V2J09_014023 [Rumex salicifolius]
MVVFQVHDKSLSGRKVPDAARGLDHHNHSMAWLRASPQRRKLRKISVIQLFAKQCLDASQLLRQNKMLELLDYIQECCKMGQAVDIGRAAFTLSLNLLSNTFFSIDLAGYSSASSQEFKDLAHNMMEVLGKPNLADFFPMLGRGYFAKMFDVFDDIISKRLSADHSSLSGKNDVLGALLETSKEDGYDLSLVDIKHLLLVR